MLFKSKRKVYLDICKQYIEGDMSLDEFWNIYSKDKKMIKDIDKIKQKNEYYYPIEYYIASLKGNTPGFFGIVSLQRTVHNYLVYHNIEHRIIVKELPLHDKWDKIIPNYLSGDDRVYFMLEEYDSNKTKSNVHYNKWLLEQFKFEKYRPRWMHFSEWPIENGKPLTFQYQTGFPNNHDFIEYHFVREDGTKVVIEQYD